MSFIFHVYFSSNFSFHSKSSHFATHFVVTLEKKSFFDDIILSNFWLNLHIFELVKIIYLSLIYFFKCLNLHYSVSYFFCFSLTFLNFLSFFRTYLSPSKSLQILYDLFPCQSVLFSLLLANIRILSCFFFLFLVMLSNFLIIPVVREN